LDPSHPDFARNDTLMDPIGKFPEKHDNNQLMIAKIIHMGFRKVKYSLKIFSIFCFQIKYRNLECPYKEGCFDKR
jgi:hypothetical protein